MTSGPLVILLAITIAWFLLPLLPAIAEWLRPTDVTPLEVVGRDAGDIPLFARGFRDYLVTRVAPVTGAPGAAEPRAGGDAGQDRVVILEGRLTLAGGETFLHEVCALGELEGGPGALYRAVLAERGLTLGERSRVLRWVHAAGRLEVGRATILQGRASSAIAVQLGRGVAFDRVGAPVIRTEGPPADRPAVAPGSAGRFSPPEGIRAIGDHLRVDGDLSITDLTTLESNVVVAGNLRLGAGAVIRGQVKVHGTATVERGARIDGSLVGRGELVIGAGAVIAGPVIAEGKVTLGPGCVIGDYAAPTTIAAPAVRLGPGVTIHGQVTTQQGGLVD